jgi:hypothetical protein
MGSGLLVVVDDCCARPTANTGPQQTFRAVPLLPRSSQVAPRKSSPGKGAHILLRRDADAPGINSRSD